MNGLVEQVRDNAEQEKAYAASYVFFDEVSLPQGCEEVHP